MKNRFVRFFVDLPVFPKILFSLLFVGVTPIFIVGISEILANRRSGAFNLTALILCLSFFLATAIAGILTRLILSPIKRLLEGIEKASKGDFDHRIEIVGKDEFGDLARAFNGMSSRIRENIREKEEHLTRLHSLKVRESQAAIAAQVAHDIRSPLAALDSVMKDGPQFPESQRLIMRSAATRIRDIANNLIEKNREFRAAGAGTGAAAAETAAAEPASVALLSSLLDPLITEKRVQSGAKAGVEIDARLDAASYGLFAEVQPAEFKRVLSNLINNGVEALDAKGAVTVRLAREDDDILLTVEDNGKGIPSETLARLGQRGETHGKAGGTGLGLYHARIRVQAWGGSLDIRSEPGKGTTVAIRLPQAPPPVWFVSTLEIAPGGAVVVFDDDVSIHQVWQGRFDSLRPQDHRIEIVHLSTPEELRGWVRDNPAKAQSALYLVDYEFLGYKETGLSMVKELNLAERSILITSRDEEKGILEECLRLKVRMIPKGLAGFVPISVRAQPQGPDAVLLDDDALVQMTWNVAAKSQGRNLLAFRDPKEFLAAVEHLPKDTPIYLDSHLAKGLRGEDIARDLHAKGFSNLFLATGHSPESLPPLPWIKKVVGKEPPWG